jgi:hypothetical protein
VGLALIGGGVEGQQNRLRPADVRSLIAPFPAAALAEQFSHRAKAPAAENQLIERPLVQTLPSETANFARHFPAIDSDLRAFHLDAPVLLAGLRLHRGVFVFAACLASTGSHAAAAASLLA